MIDPFEVLRTELVRAAETMKADATPVEGGRKLIGPAGCAAARTRSRSSPRRW
jgi:hypothetical protein